jgi:hypothetical protein
MSTTAVSTGVELRTVVADYPARFKPSATVGYPFWSGTKDERTFFVMWNGAAPFLVAAKDDPRSEGMREAYGMETTLMEAAGLDPATHLIWSIDTEQLEVTETTATSSIPECVDEARASGYGLDEYRANRLARIAAAGPLNGKVRVTSVCNEANKATWLNREAILDHIDEPDSYLTFRVHQEGNVNESIYVHAVEPVVEDVPGAAEHEAMGEAEAPTSDEIKNRAEQDLTEAYPLGSIWTHRSYGGEKFVIVGHNTTGRYDLNVVTLATGEPSGTGEWPRSALDAFGTRQPDFEVGQSMPVKLLAALPAGYLFTRRTSNGLWVTHGDGTATQIEGRQAQRMGLGYNHPNFEPTNSWVNDGWEYAGFDPEKVPADPEPEIREDAMTTEEAVKEVERLNADLIRLQEERDTAQANAERLRNSLAERTRMHESDIETISDKLIDEAESRSWCGEYDEIVDSLNANLNVELRQRTKEYEVTVDVVVRVTKTVEATSEEDAQEQAEEDISDSDLDAGNIQSTDLVNVSRT